MDSPSSEKVPRCWLDFPVGDGLPMLDGFPIGLTDLKELCYENVGIACDRDYTCVNMM